MVLSTAALDSQDAKVAPCEVARGASMVKLRMLYVGQEAVIYAISSERYPDSLRAAASLLSRLSALTAGICHHESTKALRMLPHVALQTRFSPN